MDKDIRIVTSSYAADAVRILHEAAQWLIDRGIGHWSIDELLLEDFETAADAGELVIGFERSEAAAVMFLQSRDTLYWPAELQGSALYIHKLAVRRASAGRGWGARMIEWAAGEARERAIPRLRLDTIPASVLQTLYERQGFIVVDRYCIRVGAVVVVRMERWLR